MIQAEKSLSNKLVEHYRRLRDVMPASSAIVQARYALRADATREEFEQMEADGLVRLRVEADEFVKVDDLLGDYFNPDVNTDLSPNRLKREEQEYIARIDNEGVWGLIGEYFDGETWVQADSVWGFVGDDWKNSGYDSDIMAATIDAAKKVQHCPHCARPIKHRRLHQ